MANKSRVLSLLCLALLAGAAIAYPTGSSAQDRGTRIVGGYETDIAVHPYQISLRRKSLSTPTNPFSHLCGGTIIDSDKIVTAAHCIIATVPSQYKVVAGSNYRNTTDGVIVSVSEIIMHENYNPNTLENDIAVLVLSSPLPLNNFTISAIELADSDLLPGAITTVSGWGTTMYGGSVSYKLLAVDVPIVSNEQCDQDYGGYDWIKPSMLCAGERELGGKDACQGDSGGPLVWRNKLYGVVSWGNECALPGYPGVYSSVPYLLDWVKSKVELPSFQN